MASRNHAAFGAGIASHISWLTRIWVSFVLSKIGRRPAPFRLPPCCILFPHSWACLYMPYDIVQGFSRCIGGLEFFRYTIFCGTPFISAAIKKRIVFIRRKKYIIVVFTNFKLHQFTLLVSDGFHCFVGFTDQPAGRFDLVALTINLDLTIQQSKGLVNRKMHFFCSFLRSIHIAATGAIWLSVKLTTSSTWQLSKVAGQLNVVAFMGAIGGATGVLSALHLIGGIIGYKGWQERRRPPPGVAQRLKKRGLSAPIFIFRASNTVGYGSGSYQSLAGAARCPRQNGPRIQSHIRDSPRRPAYAQRSPRRMPYDAA